MKSVCLFMIIVWLSPWCDAHLRVINIDGKTVAAAPYLLDIHYPQAGVAKKEVKMNASFFRQRNISLNPLLSSSENTLTPGIIQSRPLHTNGLIRPLFVIGDDPRSLKWAEVNATQLKNMGAIGFITHVQSLQRTKEIEQETGLTLWPVQLSGIRQYLSISHYPFLWTKEDIEQ